MNGLLTYWIFSLMMSQTLFLAQLSSSEIEQADASSHLQHVSKLSELFLAKPEVDYDTGIRVYNNSKPMVSIIIDDMGNNYSLGLQAIQLPGNITYSFLPHIPNTKALANLAHERGKEVMVHMPMQALRNLKLGPGGITHGMSQETVQQKVTDAISSLPFAKGLNNHMGSLLTTQTEEMHWVMQALKPFQIYFVDSRTNAKSIALKTAKQHRIPSIPRHVFLDHDIDMKLIDKRFQELIHIAKKRGYAVAIGHPYPATLQYLAENLSQLQEYDIELVPVSTLIGYQENITQPSR